MVNLPMYKSSSGVINTSDINKALTSAGINAGDVIFVHSDISVFGKIANYDRDSFLNSHVECLSQAVGKTGTVIMPTFSYSFCKGEIYDPLNTPSDVGILTEFFRNQPGVLRTKHPIFSVAVSGASKDAFLDIGRDSFDNDSIFGKIRKANGKIVFFGASFHSCTYLHHIEQLHGVPYRFIKNFTGKTRNGQQTTKDYATFFVRYLDRVVELDVNRLQNYLIENNIMRSVSLGEGKILTVGARELFEIGIRLLDTDPYFFLSSKSSR
ncbi:AAC(3) family N-acetyltransferase [Sporomusa aerivorans]|uniref:AAC(3) family N-acetyltransferase n=1 Tax=Sporomusa aerivorans TaxID=204936 RepID=UPI00352A724A